MFGIGDSCTHEWEVVEEARTLDGTFMSNGQFIKTDGDTTYLSVDVMQFEKRRCTKCGETEDNPVEAKEMGVELEEL